MKEIHKEVQSFKFPDPLPGPMNTSNVLEELKVYRFFPIINNPKGDPILENRKSLRWNIKVVGSYLLRSVLSLNRNIDIGVEIPRGFLTSFLSSAKPQFNEDTAVPIYLGLRSYFVSLLFGHFVNALKYNTPQNPKKKIRIGFFCHDYRKPILEISSSQGFLVKLLPLLPKDISTFGTNPIIQEDQSAHLHLENFHKSFENSPMTIESILLIKLWFRQKNLSSYSSLSPLGRFNGFQVTRFVHYLLETGVLKRTMSSYQIFRTFLVWVCKYDFRTPFQNREEDGLFVMNDCPIFWRNNASDFEKLKFEASHTLKLYNMTGSAMDSTGGGGVEIIQNCFLTRHDIFQNYDLVFSVKLSENCRNAEQVSYQSRKIEKILRVGLQGKIEYFQHEYNVSYKRRATVTFGVLLKFGDESSLQDFSSSSSSQQPYTIFGPELDEVELSEEKKFEVEEFEKFWGKEFVSVRNTPKGMLKTFQLPNTSHVKNKNAINFVMVIVEYLMKKHLSSKSSVEFHLKPILNESMDLAKQTAFLDTSESAFQDLEKFFIGQHPDSDAINFPGLEVLNVSIHSSEYRSTIANFDQPSAMSNFKKPFCATIEFQKNRHWPLGNTQAVAKLKSYIYLQVHTFLKSKILKNSETLLEEEEEEEDPNPFLGENQNVEEKQRMVSGSSLPFVKSVVFEKYMDMYHRSGCIFRVVVLIAQDPVVPEMIYVPYMTRFVTGYLTTFPFFGYVCRFLSRWLDAHMFQDHVSQDMVELFVALAYDKVCPYGVSRNSPVPMIFRLFRMLADLELGKCYYVGQRAIFATASEGTDEEEKDEQLNDELEEEARNVMDTIDPSGKVILVPSFLHFLALPHRAGLFQLGGPLVLGRLRHYASDMIQVLENWVHDEQMYTTLSSDRFWERLYQTSLSSFDVVLRVNAASFEKKLMSQHSTLEKNEVVVGVEEPFEACVHELKRRLRDMGLLFYRKFLVKWYPSRVEWVIGIVWFPNAFSCGENDRKNERVRWDGKIPVSIDNQSKLFPNIFEWIERMRNCFPCNVSIKFNQDSSKVKFLKKRKRKN